VYDAPPASATPPDDDDGLFLHERRARDAISVRGFVSPPAINRANRHDITLFVNDRWVQDIRLSTAVLQAYHTMLMVGRYPIAIIQLTVPAEDVDVNVHPTKAEVRFRYPDAAFTAVERTVRQTLTAQAPVPTCAPPWAGRRGAPALARLVARVVASLPLPRARRAAQCRARPRPADRGRCGRQFAPAGAPVPLHRVSARSARPTSSGAGRPVPD
jgi:hypothetical protein